MCHDLVSIEDLLSASSRKKLFEIFCVYKSQDRDRADLIVEVILSLGVRPQDLAVLTRNGMFRISVYCYRRLQADRLLRRLQDMNLAKVAFRQREVKIQDWNTRWAKAFAPFQLTPKIDVVPTWRRYKKTTRRAIFLSSINAFGTGLHETTRFMALLIERCQGRFQSFLDVGTGTGLLSLVAYICQAQRIVALDHDRQCLRCAGENFKINGLTLAKIVRADMRCFSSSERFDFVAANLVTQDLLDLRKRILSSVAPSGFLAISGISLDRLPEIQRHFRLLPLRCVKIIKGQQWAALLYQRASR